VKKINRFDPGTEPARKWRDSVVLSGSVDRLTESGVCNGVKVENGGCAWRKDGGETMQSLWKRSSYQSDTDSDDSDRTVPLTPNRDG
jgi:hypothetical protein